MIRDDVSMESVNGKHLYTADGKKYPSVTTILDVVSYSKPIVAWANNLGFQHKKYEDELNRTAVQGTYAHSMAQCLVDPTRGEMPVIKDPLLDYRIRKRIQNFKYQIDQNAGNWSTIFTEVPFISHTYEIGGTMDWFALWYQHRTLFDFKTSAAVRSKHLLQLGGYYLILQDNGEDIDQAGIILLKEDRCLINIFEKEIIIRCAEIFLNVKQYYYDHFYLEDAVLTKPRIIGATTM